jgi:tight adherence protein B
MALIAGVVFVGAFLVAALLMTAASPSRKSKRVQETLDSVLATESRETREQIVSVRKDARLSSIPWLNRKLVKLEVTPHLHNLLSQADLNWNAGKLLLVSAACFAVPSFVIHQYFKTLLPALAAGILAGAAPISWMLFKRSKRFGKFEEGLPEALDLMVSALRAGHSLIAAMGLVSRECGNPVGGEFKLCFDEQNYGLELKTALDNMIHRIPVQDLKIVATAILIQKESGGNLAEVLDKTAQVIRERFRLKRQVKVHTAQGRMTGWILSLLPVVLGTAIFFINPKMMSLLWHRAIGIKLMWTAGGLTLLGGLVIRNIVNLDM